MRQIQFSGEIFCSFGGYIFFFSDPATTVIYTLSLHDALPICGNGTGAVVVAGVDGGVVDHGGARLRDRKSTRLNSSHVKISYAVFCLKKKNTRILLQRKP